jgi:hypothetical protein
MRIVLGCTLAVSAFALAAGAADADKAKKKKAGPLPTDPAELFKLLDTEPADKPDGKLSQDEFLALEPKLPKPKKGNASLPDLKKVFANLDVNKDGSLSPDELKPVGVHVELTAKKK